MQFEFGISKDPFSFKIIKVILGNALFGDNHLYSQCLKQKEYINLDWSLGREILGGAWRN